MSIYIHKNGTSKPIGGGTSLSDRERIVELERLAESLQSQINELKTGMATESIPGLVRITSSAAVTDSTGLALSARENNAGIENTLANRIARNSDEIFKYQGIPTDPNTIHKSGIYAIFNDSANVPYAYGVLAHFDAGTYAMQIFKSVITANTNLYVRDRIDANNTSWNPWKKYAAS